MTPRGQYQADASILTTNDDGRRSGPPRALIVHTSQGNTNGTADDLARWQLRREAGGSYHVIIDGTGRMVRSNDDAFIPWAAGQTGNRVGLHVCLIGDADWFTSTWLGRSAQLDRLADWLRYNSTVYGIPLVWLDADRLRGTGRGVAGHDTVSQAWGEVNHYDPGAGFPRAEVLARAAGRKAPAEPPRPNIHVVQPGETLSGIAGLYGTTPQALTVINALKDPDRIYPAQVIRLKP